MVSKPRLKNTASQRRVQGAASSGSTTSSADTSPTSQQATKRSLCNQKPLFSRRSSSLVLSTAVTISPSTSVHEQASARRVCLGILCSRPTASSGSRPVSKPTRTCVCRRSLIHHLVKPLFLKSSSRPVPASDGA